METRLAGNGFVRKEHMASLLDLFRGWFAPATVEPPTPVYPVTFEPVVGYGPNGYINRYLNPDYFATRETADWVMRTFGATFWFEVTQPGTAEGLYTASHKERWVHFVDGFETNAGLIAAAYQRNATVGHENGIRAATDHIALARREWQARLAEEGGGTSGGGD